MAKVEYSSNNSGGSWWLSDTDWKNLEESGWKVDWYKDREDDLWRDKPDKNGDVRFLGALASSATREGLTMGQAIREWESITGQSSNALGCGCCGAPHSFSDGEGNYYYPDSGGYGDPYDGD
jgi:hypothetical protein